MCTIYHGLKIPILEDMLKNSLYLQNKQLLLRSFLFVYVYIVDQLISNKKIK